MNRQIQTIFCDDIRQEVGGKVTYVGVYNWQMYLSSFPATLSKLCIAVRVVSPFEKPLKKLSLRILRDTEVLAEGELDQDQLSNIIEASDGVPEDERKDRVALLQMFFVFSPFQIDEPCAIRVRADTDDGELRGVGLMVAQTPPEIEAS